MAVITLDNPDLLGRATVRPNGSRSRHPPGGGLNVSGSIYFHLIGFNHSGTFRQHLETP